jgi:hypothetical protein
MGAALEALIISMSRNNIGHIPLGLVTPERRDLRMDDNDLAKLLHDAKEMLDNTRQANYEVLNLTYNLLKAYKMALDTSKTGVQSLVSGMGQQSKGRKIRVRWSFAIGAIALIAGYLALWNSSTIGAGFHQTALIAIGSALITFCLVDLLLDKIIEIKSREARAVEKEVDKLTSLNTQIANKAQDLLENGKDLEERLDKVLPQLKTLAFPGQS